MKHLDRYRYSYRYPLVLLYRYIPTYIYHSCNIVDKEYFECTICMHDEMRHQR